jgi:uncharacterized protein
MKNAILIDTGFLYALIYTKDERHHTVKAVWEMETAIPIVPVVVLVELAYLASRDGRTFHIVSILSEFEKLNFRLENLEMQDVQRARDIMRDYVDAHLDFVDCCIMALSERLDIRRVCTVDPIDFRIFRPKHCEYLDILP